MKKAGTMAWMLAALEADTGTITAGSPFSGVNTTEMATVPREKPAPVMVRASKGLPEVSLSEEMETANVEAVMVMEAVPDLAVFAVLVAVIVTGLVVGMAAGAV